MSKNQNDANDGANLIINESVLRDKIYTVRGQRVMLDYDLAKIYGYETKAFNRQVKNNIKKFEGEDFMFQLSDGEFLRCKNCTSKVEYDYLRSKNLTSNLNSRGGNRYLPYAFTEQGIYMLMTVLRGELAVKQSRALIRMFKKMKDYIIINQESLGYKTNLQLARQVMENAHDGVLMKNKIDKLDEEIDKLNDEMDEVNEKLNDAVMKSDISPILLDFSKVTEQRECVFMDGELIRASELYMDIYGKAKKNVYIIDNYINIKTLRHLQNVKVGVGVDITIFSDNLNNHLHKVDYDDFRRERKDLVIRFIKTMGMIHDRFIIIDYGTKGETIYHSGASEKDAGKKLMVISKYNDGVVKTAIHGAVERLVGNEKLVLR